MKKTFALLSASAGVLVLLSACNSNSTATVPKGAPEPNSMETDTQVAPDDAMPDAAVDPSEDNGSEDTSSPAASDARVIEMSADDWTFEPSSITLKKGEKVVIRLTGAAGEHSFASKDLGINVAINPGETKDIEIPTDSAGTFSFRCAVPCGPGHKDMTGTIVIEG